MYVEAAYHLSYDQGNGGEQPTINLHAGADSLKSIAAHADTVAGAGRYLGLEAFGFDAEGFGYNKVGELASSLLVDGWKALRLALPKVTETAVNGHSYNAPTPRVLPIVATLATALNHLNHLDRAAPRDSNQPQLVTVSLSNRMPLGSSHSAPIQANLSPELLSRLAVLPEIAIAEDRVCQALRTGFCFPYGQANRGEFNAGFRDGNIKFKYPGDDSEFSAIPNEQKPEIVGITLRAVNNHYPIQQIAIICGLAALSDIVFEQ